MPNHTDAVALLRELRPDTHVAAFDPDAPMARASLERILATPAPPTPPRRRRPSKRRLAIAAAGVAILAAGVVALSPFAGGSPDVVARAAAALNDPGAILHYRTQSQYAGFGKQRTTEAWQTVDGLRKRIVFDGGGLESAEDQGAKTLLTYDRERNEILRHTDPDFFNRTPRNVDATDGFWDPSDIGDLAKLLQRARNGDDTVHLVGEASVRGIPTYELRIPFTLDVIMGPIKAGDDPADLPKRPVTFTRTVYVDKDTFLPVRVIEEGPQLRTITADYVAMERLPLTPENERLLQMSPHPGAKETVEGPIR